MEAMRCTTGGCGMVGIEIIGVAYMFMSVLVR